MLPTSIRHGDLVIDYQSDGSVQIVRQSIAQGIVLSISEWQYLIRVADMHDLPVAPPTQPIPEVRS